jgi:hypothetical protein
LRVVASARVDGAGPFEGAPAVFPWHWSWNLVGLGPWLLLALGVALPRTNRDPRALLIFIPMLVLAFLWQRVAGWMGITSANQIVFSFLTEFLAVGAGLLWLNADRLARYRGLVRCAASLGLVLLADAAALVAWSRTFPGSIRELLIVTILIGVVVLVSLGLARRRARRRYDPLRFALWLAAWSVLLALSLVAVPAGISIVAGSPAVDDLRSAFQRVVVPGLALGICLYAVHLPYLLLMFTSPFFRRRFCAWLGAEPGTTQPDTVRGIAEPG